MKSFYVVTNTAKDTDYSLTNSVVKYLEQKGCYCGFVPFARGFIPGEDKYVDPAMIPEDVEAIIVLGGDGTLIRAVRDMGGCAMPLLGINLGTLGYLTDVELKEFRPALDRLFRDDFDIEERMMIEGTTADGRMDLAVNDIVLAREGKIRIVQFNLRKFRSNKRKSK